MRVEFNPLKSDVLLYQLAGYNFIKKWLKKNDTVLDIGCGEGYTDYLLSNRCFRVNAIDSDKSLISDNNYKFSKGNLLFFHEDLFEKKYFDLKYSIMICRDLIEHLHTKEVNFLMKKIVDGLKPEGIAFIGTVNIMVQKLGLVSRPKEQGHINEYLASDFKKLLDRYFRRVIIFSQTDENIILSEAKDFAWRWIAVCMNPIKKEVI